MTVILGLIAKGQEYFSSRDKKKFSNIIDIVQQNAHGLLSLVNQMLDLSRLESKSIQLNMVNVDVISFLKNLAGMFDSHAENHNLSLNFNSSIRELHMDYDPDNLQKIVSNILSNSIKFTDSGSVNVLVDEKIINDKKHVLIRVKDTGIEISEEDLPSIFDRFFQAENSNKKSITGSGIGMALVKELVELMGGQVDIKSQLGIGTEVIFSLPINSKEEPAIHSKRIFAKEIFEKNDLQVEPNNVTNSDGNAIVLTIEDNKDVQYYLNTCLQDNYQIINASDGEEGISIAMEYVPDIIISDVMMPGKDGYEVCDILKQDTHTSHIPIIL
ncbi:MAG: hybrid sensor histidine kinase/response regulator, partial [Cyclobacteriaceae bacterium]|nr:hybrid sensor histidine kinase/response regulator [Cyclobacteriaceae bacterium]